MTSRTLQFPTDPTGAKLTLSGEALDPPRQDLEARGEIDVPEGVQAFLTVSSSELGVLAQLPPGDLDSLTVTDPASGLGAAVGPLGAVRLVLEGACQPGAIAELGGCEGITDLSLDMALGEDRAVELAGLSQLTSLRMSGAIHAAVPVVASGLMGLSTLIVQSELSIAGGLDALGNLLQLERLLLLAPDIDDGVVAQIPPLPAVTMLWLGGPELRGNSLGALCALPMLDVLVIRQSPAFDIQTLPALAGSPSLTMLVIGDVPGIDDQAVPYLATLSAPLRQIMISAEGKSRSDTFSLSAKVWFSRVRPDFELNGFSATPKAVARYVAAGLGADPRTGELELTP